MQQILSSSFDDKLVDHASALCYKRVMNEKQQLNFSLPLELIAAFEEVAKRVPLKKKWQVCSAAILLLLEQPDHIIDEHIRDAAMADNLGGSFAELVREAKELAGKPAQMLHGPEIPKPKQKASKQGKPDAKNRSDTSKHQPRL